MDLLRHFYKFQGPFWHSPNKLYEYVVLSLALIHLTPLQDTKHIIIPPFSLVIIIIVIHLLIYLVINLNFFPVYCFIWSGIHIRNHTFTQSLFVYKDIALAISGG